MSRALRASETATNGPRRVIMVVFPGVQILDATGPTEAFSIATRNLVLRGIDDPGYEVELVAADAGPIPASSGIEIVAKYAYRDLDGPVDTLLVAGGLGVPQAQQDRGLTDWLRGMAPRVRRLGSVCTGAAILAEAGLLDGRRATTHWMYCETFAAAYPNVTVEPDPIFVKDGNVYTSAGVTAGMDLALGLVEEDLGRDLALAVARQLVLFLKRPGGQAQFSVQLQAQEAERQPIRELQTWIHGNLAAELSIEALAERVHMSPRNFARVFTREVGVTPARYVERVRVEAARRQLEDSNATVDEIAAACGFGSMETLRRAFLRTVRVAPADYRKRFHPTSQTA